MTNDIEDDKKKRTVLVTSMGNTAHTTLRNLTAPKTPIETDWKELLKLMEEHYSPKANTIVERCKFYQRFRQTGESVSIFIAELRALADKCELGDQLTTSLRDRLVCGIADDRMQRGLLSEPYKDLTLDKAVDLSMTMEIATKNVLRLQDDAKQQVFVNTLKSSSRQSKSTKLKQGHCMRCGDAMHHSNECPFKEVECFACGKKGHLKKVCLSKDKAGQRNEGRRMQSYRSRDRRKNKPVHFVHPEYCPVVAGAEESYDSEPVFVIHSNEHVPPITKSLKINGKGIEFELDTGSGVSIISAGTAETLFDGSVSYRPEVTYIRRP